MDALFHFSGEACLFKGSAQHHLETRLHRVQPGNIAGTSLLQTVSTIHDEVCPSDVRRFITAQKDNRCRDFFWKCHSLYRGSNGVSAAQGIPRTFLTSMLFDKRLPKRHFFSTSA